MNSVDFLEAIGGIDDIFVFEVEELKKRKKTKQSIRFVIQGAACLALFTGLGLFWQSNLKSSVQNHKDNAKYEEEGAVEENAVISEKHKGEGKDANSDLANQNYEMPNNEIMENIGVFVASHELPDWFGDYYLENDMVYVLLVDNNETNQNQVKEWAKSENIIFKKADFSLNYLNEVIENIAEDMDSGKIDFIDIMTLDSQANRIKIETKGDISAGEKASIYGYDKLGKGSAFIINTGSNDTPKEELDLIDEAKKQLPSSKPLVKGDSQVIMDVKNNNDVLVIRIKNKSGHKILFGAGYILYRKNNHGRERIEYLPDVGVEDIAYIVEKDETYTDEIKLSDIFGELKNGEYVIGKEISLLDSNRVVASAEFKIKN